MLFPLAASQFWDGAFRGPALHHFLQTFSDGSSLNSLLEVDEYRRRILLVSSCLVVTRLAFLAPCHLLILGQVKLRGECAPCGVTADMVPLPDVRLPPTVPSLPIIPLSPGLVLCAPRSCRPWGSPTTLAVSAVSSVTSAWTGCPSPWTQRTRSTVSEITTSKEGWDPLGSATAIET